MVKDSASSRITSDRVVRLHLLEQCLACSAVQFPCRRDINDTECRSARGRIHRNRPVRRVSPPKIECGRCATLLPHIMHTASSGIVCHAPAVRRIDPWLRKRRLTDNNAPYPGTRTFYSGLPFISTKQLTASEPRPAVKKPCAGQRRCLDSEPSIIILCGFYQGVYFAKLHQNLFKLNNSRSPRNTPCNGVTSQR